MRKKLGDTNNPNLFSIDVRFTDSINYHIVATNGQKNGSARKSPGGGGNAIYVPYGDVPPIRVYFLAFESETGCLFSILTLKQGAKFVRSIRARCLFTVLFGTLTLVLTYLSFVQEIKPRFDVFNIFSYNMTYSTRSCQGFL